jgi:hypothetical protein
MSSSHWQVYRFTQVKLGQLQQGSGRQEFKVLCPHVIWWVQDVPEVCSIHSAVLCYILAFPSVNKRNERKKKKKERGVNNFPVGKQAAVHPMCWQFFSWQNNHG